MFFVVNTAPKCDASPKPPIYVELHKNQAQGAQFWMVLNECTYLWFMGWSKFFRMANGDAYYFDLLNNHRRTSKLYGIIPFKFILHKTEVAIMTLIGTLLMGYCTDMFIIFGGLGILFSTEYTRLFDYRQKIYEACILEEEVFKLHLKSDGIDPNFPQDPLYITVADQEQFFSESISSIRSYHIFKVIWMKVKTLLSANW